MYCKCKCILNLNSIIIGQKSKNDGKLEVSKGVMVYEFTTGYGVPLH